MKFSVVMLAIAPFIILRTLFPVLWNVLRTGSELR